MRLIDAIEVKRIMCDMYFEAIRKAITERTEDSLNNIANFALKLNETAAQMIAAVKNAPTVDAVPVIRCKDCKHHKTCTHARRLGINGYCSEGEKT